MASYITTEKETENYHEQLLLWRRDLLHVDPGYWIPAGVRVSITVTSTITDRETHFHLPTRDLFAHSFNLTDTMQIFYSIWCCTAGHVDYAVNGKGRAALGAIKGEVPPLAARVAVVDTKIAIEENAQTSVIWSFLENTLLRKVWRKKEEIRKENT